MIVWDKKQKRHVVMPEQLPLPVRFDPGNCEDVFSLLLIERYGATSDPWAEPIHIPTSWQLPTHSVGVELGISLEEDAVVVATATTTKRRRQLAELTVDLNDPASIDQLDAFILRWHALIRGVAKRRCEELNRRANEERLERLLRQQRAAERAKAQAWKRLLPKAALTVLIPPNKRPRF